MKETNEFWDGFDAALNLLGYEVDKILSTCYNERRTQNDLLDVKVAINDIREMNPHGKTTLAMGMP